jgi:hypothetical protein
VSRMDNPRPMRYSRMRGPGVAGLIRAVKAILSAALCRFTLDSAGEGYSLTMLVRVCRCGVVPRYPLRRYCESYHINLRDG